MKRTLGFVAVTLAWTGSVLAQHEHGKGPNGGQVTDAGLYHIELVSKPGIVDVFVSDATEKPMPATGFKGTAIFVVDGKSQRIVLEPDGGRLSGKATVVLPVQPKGVVQLTGPDGKTAQGKFN